jgi:hypothetical protein
MYRGVLSTTSLIQNTWHGVERSLSVL